MDQWSDGFDEALHNAAFSVVGKMFSLRGGIEHRNLNSQIEVTSTLFIVRTSRRQRMARLRKYGSKKKVVPIYTCPDLGERCPVNILDTYLNKLPQENDIILFYLRPLSQIPTDPTLPWYAPVPVEKGTLKNKLNTMCKQAGITGNKTNHSH